MQYIGSTGGQCFHPPARREFQLRQRKLLYYDLLATKVHQATRACPRGLGHLPCQGIDYTNVVSVEFWLILGRNCQSSIVVGYIFVGWDLGPTLFTHLRGCEYDHLVFICFSYNYSVSCYNVKPKGLCKDRRWIFFVLESGTLRWCHKNDVTRRKVLLFLQRHNLMKSHEENARKQRTHPIYRWMWKENLLGKDGMK